VVSFTPLPLYPRGKGPRYPLDAGWAPGSVLSLLRREKSCTAGKFYRFRYLYMEMYQVDESQSLCSEGDDKFTVLRDMTLSNFIDGFPRFGGVCYLHL
jgi:hypothetical protein